ncbi:DUF2283 domain-containing protein [Streptosporangium sp. NPDC001559]|uniref:DUF2283 domain-containing protein n=1 Tax=Streptosporangium sp. NPDC001559 TaxID=3366187 RepID=UPI0036E15516
MDPSKVIDGMSPEERLLALEYFAGRDCEEFLYAAEEARRRYQRAGGYRASALERHPGSWTYDPDASATYVYLHGPIPDGGVARCVPVDAMVNLDLDADGRVIGIEILAAWPQAPKEDR